LGALRAVFKPVNHSIMAQGLVLKRWAVFECGEEMALM
jgi:hypothetical protein